MILGQRVEGSHSWAQPAVATSPLSSIWTPYGNLLLNPGDPGLGALSQMQLLMIKNGIYDTGDKSAIAFPPLGPAAKGMILKAQGVVWNPNFKDIRVTTSSSILID